MSDRLTAILDAIVAKAQGLALAVGGTPFVVQKRQAAVHRTKMDPERMITVAKSATPEQVTRRRFGLWQTAYVVDVVVHSPYGGPDADLAPYVQARDTLVDAFKRPPLAGAPDVFEMDAQPADWLRPLGETTAWEWQSLQVTATVAHS